MKNMFCPGVLDTKHAFLKCILNSGYLILFPEPIDGLWLDLVNCVIEWRNSYFPLLTF